MGFVVVPAVLGGTLLLPLWEAGGGLVLELAHTCIAWLWPYLEVLESQAPVLRATGTAPEWAVAAGGVGAIVLLAPRGWPGRWVGVAWFLPLALTVPDGPARGELWVSVLDVGQGLSVVLRTERRVLVYDAGPWFSESFDAGAGIVVPYLQAQGLNRLDMLVLSHGHRDHVGGARSLLERIPTNVVLGNVPNLGVEPGRNLACRAGHRWIWDEVQFQVVHPARGDKAQGNDASCALLVRTGGASILLPGDLERHGEATLTERYPGPNDLKADFLVVPHLHHGSATSSSQALLDAVDPRLALLSVGYRNRFGLPASAVMARYRARNEVSYHKRHKYATLVYDLERSVVVWVGQGRGRATIDQFFDHQLSGYRAGHRYCHQRGDRIADHARPRFACRAPPSRVDPPVLALARASPTDGDCVPGGGRNVTSPNPGKSKNWVARIRRDGSVARFPRVRPSRLIRPDCKRGEGGHCWSWLRRADG